MTRRSLYTPELVEEICARLSNGEPLAVICRDEGMPNDDTVRNWAAARPEVAQAIARARDSGEEVIAANLREVARGKSGSSGDVQRDKLIIDTDLKLLAKWNPKKWGDRIQHANDPESPMPAPQWLVQPIAPK